MGRLFGTDGIRGVANKELTAELAQKVGKAVALTIGNGSRRRPIVAIGCDTRASSDMLVSAISAGLCSIGADVINLGVISTPAVAFLIGKYKADAGIVVSASHNTAEYNGIKVFGGDGFKLPDELEEQVESIVLSGEETKDLPIGNEIGRIIDKKEEAKKDYIAHVKSSVLYSLKGLKVAIDCANGASFCTAEKIFKDLGADVVILSNKPNGANINKDCGSTHLEALSKYVKENKLDMGVAFDGDADRCLCVDENGEICDGDTIMAICSLDLMERGRLNGNSVVGTIMTNFGFVKFCEERNLKFIATKVGDKYVLEEMLVNDYSFGGEQSGHIIFRDFATTGDGQLTGAQLMSIVSRKGEKLSKLASVVKRYPQTIVNVSATAEAKRLFYTNSAIKDKIEEVKETLGSKGRIVVRPSGTEPLIRVMAEGEDEVIIKKVAEETANLIKKELA